MKVAFMLGSFAVGAVVMIFFDSTLSRIVGMTALIAFMVSGVFVVAAPELLDPDEPESPGAGER